jgi:hypothetical protein
MDVKRRKPPWFYWVFDLMGGLLIASAGVVLVISVFALFSGLGQPDRGVFWFIVVALFLGLLIRVLIDIGTCVFELKEGDNKAALEREHCAKLAEEMGAKNVASAIRSRGSLD